MGWQAVTALATTTDSASSSVGEDLRSTGTQVATVLAVRLGRREVGMVRYSVQLTTTLNGEFARA